MFNVTRSVAERSTAPAATVYYSPCAKQVAGRGIRERWWCDYSDYNANLVMAEQSLNDLILTSLIRLVYYRIMYINLG